MSQYSYDPYVPVRESNSLGVAGFVISLIGLVLTGGVLCPIGLILSLVALGRRPRGFAIAGTILGLLGTCGGLLVILIAGGAILAALGIGLAAIALQEPQKLELTGEMAKIAVAVAQYKEQNHYVPASLTLVHLNPSDLNDPWGTPYKYEVLQDGQSFDIVSAGEDRAFDTPDDLKFSQLDKVWQGTNIHFGSGPGQGGAVQIDFGDHGKLDVKGDKDGGTVTIDAGGRTIHIKGGDEGGEVDATTQPTSQPD